VDQIWQVKQGAFAFRRKNLQANCALGKVRSERQIEGIQPSLESNGTEFSEDVSGRVMFLAIRPEVRASAKTPRARIAVVPVLMLVICDENLST
jgi:hypothetical protein